MANQPSNGSISGIANPPSNGSTSAIANLLSTGSTSSPSTVVAGPGGDKPRVKRRYTMSASPNGTESYGCQICSRSFDSARALGGHQNAHRKPKADAPAAPARESGEAGPSVPRLLWLGPGLPTKEWKESTDLKNNASTSSAPQPSYGYARRVQAGSSREIWFGPEVLPENWKLGD